MAYKKLDGTIQDQYPIDPILQDRISQPFSISDYQRGAVAMRHAFTLWLIDMGNEALAQEASRLPLPIYLKSEQDA